MENSLCFEVLISANTVVVPAFAGRHGRLR